jgi:glycosyl transferase, family 25
MNTIFDKIIFIHCEHRKDRFKNIQKFIKKFNLTNYHILNATYLPDNGAKGCSHSHYRAMQYSIENNFNNVLILEDDLVINQEKTIINKKLNDIFNIEKWDIIMLSWFLNAPEKRSSYFNNNLRKITHKKYGGATTAAYAVNKNMFSILKDKFLESYNLFPDKYIHKLHRQYACDNVWLPIQYKYNWYICYPKIGEQENKLYSDISINRINS